MERRLGDNLHIWDEIFIPIDRAVEYLVDKRAIFHFDEFYYYYKGFAYFDNAPINPKKYDPERKHYLDVMCSMFLINHNRFWWSTRGKGKISVRRLEIYMGQVNGRDVSFESLCENFEFTNYEIYHDYFIDRSNVFVKKSYLDSFSQKYGIPKNPLWCNKLKLDLDLDKKPEVDNNDSILNEISCPKDSIIKFIKSVLFQYPDITTADLKKNCFEDMNNLNERDGKIINDFLIKAGAKKSKRGEHANDIPWENKYPKAQWERVFNKKNLINNQ